MSWVMCVGKHMSFVFLLSSFKKKTTTFIYFVCMHVWTPQSCGELSQGESLGLAGCKPSSWFNERPCLRGIRRKVTEQDTHPLCPHIGRWHTQSLNGQGMGSCGQDNSITSGILKTEQEQFRCCRSNCSCNSVINDAFLHTSLFHRVGHPFYHANPAGVSLTSPHGQQTVRSASLVS